MIITIKNSIWSKVERSNVHILQPCLSYQYKKHSYNPFARVKSSYTTATENLISPLGAFLTGHLPRVTKYLDKKSIPYEIDDQSEVMYATETVALNNITLRPDQKRLVDAIIKNQRGVIISPTGSGKTVIAGAIITSYYHKKVLFLCHTKTLLRQAESDFKEFGLECISIVGDHEKDLTGNIVIATWQSFTTLDAEPLADMFDIVIIDEVHHLSGKDVKYVNILKNLLAPVRVGLTATYPVTDAAKFTIEGLLGEIIGEVTLEEGAELDILAKPTIKLIKAECSSDLSDLRLYSDFYNAVIINNRSRNAIIIDEIKKQNEVGNSTLTYVSMIEHGNNLCIMAADLGVPVTFIQGKTNGEDRELYRKLLQEKKMMNIIATSVWTEGMNVKSVNCIVIAGGGKSEVRLLQTVGRGLRKDVDKDTVIIIDFIDNAKYISQHCCQRLGIYTDYGWL